MLSTQDLVALAGPEEMKWPQKQLYTYNVQNGDRFIVDEKVPLPRLRSRNSSSMCSTSPHSPGMPSSTPPGTRPPIAISVRPIAAKDVAKNLFGSSQKDGKE